VDLKEYIQRAAEQTTGSELFIPCEHKKQQMKMRTALNNLAEEYCSRVNPDIFLLVKRIFKDGRLWVVIQKFKRTQAVFTKETEVSKVKKITTESPEIQRMIKNMRDDGYGEEKINEIVNAYKEQLNERD